MNADNRKTVYGIAEVIGKPDDTFGEVVEAVFVFVSTYVLLFHHRIFSTFFAVNHCQFHKTSKQFDNVRYVAFIENVITDYKAFMHFGLGHICG